MTESKIADIKLALREYYAAQNSVRRAYKELSELIPPGVLVVHRKPGDVDGPRTLYWTWENVDGEEKPSLLNGVERWSDLQGRNVVIVESPMPGEEFLPRLAPLNEFRDRVERIVRERLPGQIFIQEATGCIRVFGGGSDFETDELEACELDDQAYGDLLENRMHNSRIQLAQHEKAGE